MRKDPKMAHLIDSFELIDWSGSGALYVDLLRAVVGQQLSVKAARTIWGRVEILLNANFSPENILKTSDDKLREAGMSWAKIKYVNGIAEAFKNGEVDEKKIAELSDEDVITELTKLKGVGRWTAEMLLMSSLGRQDVFSLGDLGLRSAVSKIYKVDRDDLKKIEKISLKWKPYRSIASKYLWESLDNAPK